MKAQVVCWAEVQDLGMAGYAVIHNQKGIWNSCVILNLLVQGPKVKNLPLNVLPDMTFIT